MSRIWAEWLTDISMYSIGLPVLLGFIRFRYWNSVQRWIAGLVLASLLGEVLVRGMAHLFGNNLILLHGFTLVQFVLLIFIFEKGLKPLLPQLFFRGLILFFLIFTLTDLLFLNGLQQFNSFSRPLASFIIIFFALSFFYKTLTELKIKHLEQSPLFWISIGCLLYFSGSLFIFIFTNYVRNSNEVLLTLWGIHALFNILLNSSYTIALWVKPRL